MLDTTTPNARPAEPVQEQTPEPAPARRGWGWAVVVLVLLAASGAGGWWWWHTHRAQQAAAAPPPPMKVPVMTVVPRTMPIYRSFPATTEAIRSVPIQARVTGYLQSSAVPDGSDVAQGDLLYKIDPSDYHAAFTQAQGQVQRSAAGLSYSRVSQGRNQTLARDGWVSRDTADQVDSTMKQAAASLTSDQAALAQAALNLGRTEIRAAFAGRISRSQVYEGSLISVAGTTLNSLVQLDPVYVAFNPADVNLPAITATKARAPIEAAVNVPGVATVHEGTVTFIDNQVDRSTGTILLRATIANQDHALRPGQYVTVRLHLGDRDGALLVPQSAINTSQIGRTVMVLGQDGKVAQRMVVLGDTYDDLVIVTDGVKAGDRVITGQLQKLKPGMAVEVEPGADSK